MSLTGARTYRMNRLFGCPLGIVIVTSRWSHRGPTRPRAVRGKLPERGDGDQTTAGTWIERAPTQCPSGHRLDRTGFSSVIRRAAATAAFT
jgi:hypothetical protein